jgi:hypothetical protein
VDDFWVGKLQDDAVNDIFSTLFGGDLDEPDVEQVIAKKVDEIVNDLPAEHVTEAWDIGGIPAYWLAALWGMGGKWVKKTEKTKPAPEPEPEPELPTAAPAAAPAPAPAPQPEPEPEPEVEPGVQVDVDARVIYNLMDIPMEKWTSAQVGDWAGMIELPEQQAELLRDVVAITPIDGKTLISWSNTDDVVRVFRSASWRGRLPRSPGCVGDPPEGVDDDSEPPATEKEAEDALKSLETERRALEQQLAQSSKVETPAAAAESAPENAAAEEAAVSSEDPSVAGWAALEAEPVQVTGFGGPDVAAWQAKLESLQAQTKRLQTWLGGPPDTDWEELADEVLTKRDIVLQGMQTVKTIGLKPNPPRGKTGAFKRSFHSAVNKVVQGLSADKVDLVYGMMLDSLSRVLLRRTLRKGIRTVRTAVSLAGSAWGASDSSRGMEHVAAEPPIKHLPRPPPREPFVLKPPATPPPFVRSR